MANPVCEFCHTDRDGYVVNLPREGQGKAHVWHSPPIYGGWHIHVSLANRVQTRIKIKFCPMCGRELKERE